MITVTVTQEDLKISWQGQYRQDKPPERITNNNVLLEQIQHQYCCLIRNRDKFKAKYRLSNAVECFAKVVLE